MNVASSSRLRRALRSHLTASCHLPPLSLPAPAPSAPLAKSPRLGFGEGSPCSLDLPLVELPTNSRIASSAARNDLLRCVASAVRPSAPWCRVAQGGLSWLCRLEASPQGCVSMCTALFQPRLFCAGRSRSRTLPSRCPDSPRAVIRRLTHRPPIATLHHSIARSSSNCSSGPDGETQRFGGS